MISFITHGVISWFSLPGNFRKHTIIINSLQQFNNYKDDDPMDDKNMDYQGNDSVVG